MQVTPIGEMIAADIHGVDLSQPLDNIRIAAINDVWNESLVLRFRNQHLSDADLIRFSSYFGDLDPPGPNPYGVTFLPEFPEINVISNVKDDTGVPIGNLGDGEAVWHADMTYIDNPPEAGILYALEVPIGQGDTYFANMVAAYKDLPAELPEGLEVISTSNREDPRDVLVSKSNKTLMDLNDNPKIGTGSSRRSEQLAHIRKDVNIIPIRGNVDTRIRKALETDIDGVVLANAGIKRLSLSNHVCELFDIDVIVPSPLQGFLAIEAREDADLTKYFEHFSSEESVLVSNYERQFLKDLNLQLFFL